MDGFFLWALSAKGLGELGGLLLRQLALPRLWLGVLLLGAALSFGGESLADELAGSERHSKFTDKTEAAASQRNAQFRQRYKFAQQKLGASQGELMENFLAKPKGRISPKIVGGSESVPGAYPWMAAIVLAGQFDNVFAQFCGASLVHPYWIVTAAHCVEDVVAGDIEILLGVHDLANDLPAQRIAVAEIVIHPDYRGTNLEADLALLRLAEPADVAFTPLRLAATAEDDALGSMARILGWGDLVDGSNMGSPTLQEADVPVVSVLVANATDTYQGSLTQNMLPAGFAQGGVDSCQGDSGGPLVIWSDTLDDWVLAGVTSFGVGCGSVESYGIYTRIRNYQSFIIEHMYPSFAKWLAASGAVGVWHDTDGDGLDNWGEFALGGSPVDGRIEAAQGLNLVPIADGSEIFAGLGFRARFYEPEVNFVFQVADPDLSSWAALDLAGQVLVDEELDDDTALRDMVVGTGYRMDEGGEASAYFRLRASPAGDYFSGPRTLRAGKFATGALTEDDEDHPVFVGRKSKIYRLLDPVVGEPLAVTARSPSLDLTLELLDAESFAVLELSNVDNALGVRGGDEKIEFTPQAGVSYLLRVSSAGVGELGAFRLASFSPAILTSGPSIGATQTITASLSTNDLADPLWLPTIFYKKDYRLVVAGGERILLNLISSQFDAFLEIVDAETGQLIVDDDDGGVGFNSSLILSTVPGFNYLVRVTTALSLETGVFTLISELAAPLTELVVPTVYASALTAESEFDPNFPGTYKKDVLITGVAPGDVVRVRLISSDFDAFLFLLDATNEGILDFNDDGPGLGTNSELVFTVGAGREYIIRASTFAEGETGSFELQLSFN